MNREDAIKVLKSLVECLSIDCDDDCEHCHIQFDGITAVLEACAVAVTELSQPDPYTVNRQVAIDAICDDWCGYTNANCPHGSEAEHYCYGCDAIHILKTLPPSQTPSRPQAEMIQESYYSNKLVCSNCGTEARWDYEFCPYCGLKFNQTGGCGMIQIDMDKPKDCIWADITNHIYYCPFLNEYHKCNLQDYEPRTIEEQYVHCPLHEVNTDSDTISRKAAIDALEKSRFPGAPYIDRGILIALREIKKLPSAQPETHEERTETHGVCLDAIDRQAAEEFEQKHRQYKWLKGQSDDEICFKYKQSQVIGGEHG